MRDFFSLEPVLSLQLPRWCMKGTCPHCLCLGGSTNLVTGAVLGEERLQGRGEMPGQKHCNLEEADVSQGNKKEKQNGSGSE